MSSQVLWTYSDLFESLADSAGLDAVNGRNIRLVTKAIDRAYHRLAGDHQWIYYQGTFQLQTNAPYSTGTISYTASTRTFTLAGGTWPDWSAYGHARIDGTLHRVASRKSDGELILDPNESPAGDIAAGTSYELSRYIYPLPLDCRKVNRIVDSRRACDPIPTEPDRFQEYLTGFVNASGQPRLYMYLGSPDFLGSRSIALAPCPDDEYTYTVSYQRWPRPLRVWRYDMGNVEFTAGDKTITGVNTAWKDSMVGSLLRVAEGQDKPTGPRGENPYYAERTILAVNSTTELIVDAVMPANPSAAGNGYTISDPVDIDTSCMLDALLAGAEERLAAKSLLVAQPRDSGETRWQRQEVVRNYQDALARAIQNDNAHAERDDLGGYVARRFVANFSE